MSRLAIVGCEASGKTVMTASLADCFRAGREGRSCCMVPDNLAAHRFVEYTNYQMRVRHEWPHATNPDKALSLEWSLMIDGGAVASLEMLEFGGEVFRAAFRSGSPAEAKDAAVKELMDYLSRAEFIVVTISLAELVRDLDGNAQLSQEDLARDSEAKWVTRGILDFVKTRLPPETGLVVALTQADAYRSTIESCGGPRALFEKCWPAVAAVCPNVPVLAVSSVGDLAPDGTPAEGFSTDGVLPVMEAFGDYCVGGFRNLLDNVDRTLEVLESPPEGLSPQSYRQYIQDFEDGVGMMKIVSGFSGDRHDATIAQYVEKFVGMQDGVATRLREMEAKALAAWKEEERRRKEAAAAAAREKAERERKAAEEEERRRQEDLKRAEDERIRAEKELERQELQAEVDLAAARLKTRIGIAIAAAAAVCLVGLGALGFYFADRIQRQKAVEADFLHREGLRRGRAEKLAKMSEAALAGDVASARRLVAMIDDGSVDQADVPDLNKVYMVLVGENDAEAMFRLGLACLEGTGGAQKSKANARAFFEMAKKAGLSSARLDEMLRKTAADAPDDATAADGAENSGEKNRSEGD